MPRNIELQLLGLLAIASPTKGVTRRAAADAKRLQAKAAALREAGRRDQARTREVKEVIREEKARGGRCPRVLRP